MGIIWKIRIKSGKKTNCGGKKSGIKAGKKRKEKKKLGEKKNQEKIVNKNRETDLNQIIIRPAKPCSLQALKDFKV